MARGVKTSTRVRNNSGVVMYGGTTSATITRVVGMESAGYRPRKFDNAAGSAQTATQIGNGTATRGLWKPYASGNYNNKMTPGNFVMMKYTNYLAGVASTLLNTGGAAPYVRYIHKSERLRTSFLTAWSWTRASGNNVHGDPKAVTVYTATVSNKSEKLANIATGLFTGVDEAAAPTKAVPGSLVYLTKKTTTTTDYQPKTG